MISYLLLNVDAINVIIFELTGTAVIVEFNVVTTSFFGYLLLLEPY